ncbi:MAG: isoprenylcysteine carboxylmethyltransferase family protein [Anaerolineales bacterium]|jgi:protein-S-isoprenylcysteine O-methyltransferase Ste14
MNKPKLLPPSYFLNALLAIPILHFLLPLLKIIPSPWNLPGIVFILAGIAIELSADRLFHQAGTTVVPYAESKAMVTSGVFRFTRNPMYMGFTLILFGAAVLFGTLSPFLVIPFFMALIERRFIRTEEKMLELKFGQAYLDYKKKVRRWI